MPVPRPHFPVFPQPVSGHSRGAQAGSFRGTLASSERQLSLQDLTAVQNFPLGPCCIQSDGAHPTRFLPCLLPLGSALHHWQLAPRASPGSLPIRLTTFPLINFWYVYSCLVSVSWRTQTDSCLLRTAFQHHPGNFLHLFFGRFLVSWIRGLHLSWFTFFFGGMHTPHGQENWWNLAWLKTLISPSRDKLAGYGILVWKVIFHHNFKYILHCRIVYSATFYIWFFVCDLFFSDRCIFKHIISSILYSLELISLNFINLLIYLFTELPVIFCLQHSL